MDIKNTYKNFAYKVKLRLAADVHQATEIILERLPVLLEENRVEELVEVKNFLNSEFPNFLSRDAIHKLNTHILEHIIVNDKVEMFQEFRGSMIETSKDLVPLLIDQKNPELIRIFCTAPVGIDHLTYELEARMFNAAEKRDYDKLDIIFKDVEELKKHIESTPPPPDKKSTEYTSKDMGIFMGYQTALHFAGYVKELVSQSLFNHSVAYGLKEVVDYALNKVNSVPLKDILIQKLICDDRAELLKSLIVNPKVMFSDTAKSTKGYLNPDNLFLEASVFGSVETMKFAVEFNAEPFNIKTLTEALENSVSRLKKNGIEYLLKEFDQVYGSEMLNNMTQNLIESRKFDIAHVLKQNSSLISVEVPIPSLDSKNYSDRLDAKISRLRDNAFKTAPETTNNLTV